MRTTTKTCRACGRSFPGGDVFCPDDGSRLLAAGEEEAAAADPLIGTTLDGRYRVLRVRGEGGMGIVYEGEHTLIERRVAIKVLRDDFCRRPEAVERFRREAKSASRIGHPNIVDVLDFGETAGGASYFVMEMLEGKDLADVLAKTGALSPTRAVAIIHQCCLALAAAHDKGIVHRDLKPENILLVERDGSRDFVKIVDFGVAKMSELEWNLDAQPKRSKLTRTGVVFGTPEYMSPEQAGGLLPDHRVDIYALGVTLYELLTGRVPFEGSTFMSVLSKHANKPVPLLSEVNPALEVSAELESLVYCAMRKERDERFQSMQEMAASLAETPEFAQADDEARAHHPSRPATRMRAHSAFPTTQLSPLQGSHRALDGSTRSGRSTPALALGVGLAALAVVGAAAVYAAGGQGQGYPRSEIATQKPQALQESPPRPAADSPSPLSATPGAAAPTASPIAPAVPPSLEPELTAALPTGPGLDLITVRVTTQPPGARVRIGGGSEVCAKTPCAFEVMRGTPLTLHATRGASKTTTVIRPSETTELYLVLEGRGEKPTPPPSEAPASSDGLKWPEMFRDPIK
jgi:serine/threonine-protein kinase